MHLAWLYRFFRFFTAFFHSNLALTMFTQLSVLDVKMSKMTFYHIGVIFISFATNLLLYFGFASI